MIIPEDTAEGPRLITVGVAETALSADAILFVDTEAAQTVGLAQWWLWLLIAALLILLLLLAVWIWRRRRRRPSSPRA